MPSRSLWHHCNDIDGLVEDRRNSMVFEMRDHSHRYSYPLVVLNTRKTRLHHETRFNIKTTSYQYRTFHCGNKTVVKSSYLPNGISHAGETTSLYWFNPLETIVLGHIDCFDFLKIHPPLEWESSRFSATMGPFQLNGLTRILPGIRNYINYIMKLLTNRERNLRMV